MSAGGLARLGVRCATPSQGMATIGLFCGSAAIEPIPAPQPGGRGSGPTNGVRPYYDYTEDALLETRRKRILLEDNDILALITSIVTRNLL